MPISIKDVEYVAALAKLELSETGKKKFAKELNKIIKYIDQLKEVDTQNVSPTSHVIPGKFLREDKAEPSLSQKEALANAPDKRGGYVKVSKVI
jgi:aspartyl-tRNA(Asn)/glutamyl-tRNA(Gln) amidotransferase subunit C